jgi:hypothetical protein
MTNAARKLARVETFIESGTIVRSADGAFSARTEIGEMTAARAASCLVEPTVGDRVLLSVAGDECYVLAVLSHEDGAATRLVVDGDLEIHTRKGRLALASPDGIDLVGGKDVSVVAGAFNVNAVTADMVLERLSFLGASLRAEVGKMKLFGGTLDATLDRISHRVKRSFRRVEELDEVRAEQIDYAAGKTLSLKGEQTVMTARGLVKVDGEQVHIG